MNVNKQEISQEERQRMLREGKVPPGSGYGVNEISSLTDAKGEAASEENIVLPEDDIRVYSNTGPGPIETNTLNLNGNKDRLE